MTTYAVTYYLEKGHSVQQTIEADTLDVAVASVQGALSRNPFITFHPAEGFAMNVRSAAVLTFDVTAQSGEGGFAAGWLESVARAEKPHLSRKW
jgi:hypothetical protein